MQLEALIAQYASWLGGFSSVLVLHPYVFIFIGLLIGGETVLLPAIYLAITGTLSLSYVTAIMLVSTVISDILWYYVGLGSVPFLSRRTIKPRVQQAVTGLSRVFQRNDAYVLFMSKFIYGTRIAAQVLCGMHKMNFRRYLVVNTAGVLALMAAYALVVYSVIETVDAVGSAKYRLHITFASIIAILAAIQVSIKYFFKKWSR